MCGVDDTIARLTVIANNNVASRSTEYECRTQAGCAAAYNKDVMQRRVVNACVLPSFGGAKLNKVRITAARPSECPLAGSARRIFLRRERVAN